MNNLLTPENLHKAKTDFEAHHYRLRKNGGAPSLSEIVALAAICEVEEAEKAKQRIRKKL